MFSEQLTEAVSETSPAGEEGVYTLAFQELAALSDYLAARLELAEFERMAKLEFTGDNAESDQRVAQSNVEDARRRVERAEANVKEITGRAPSPDSARNELRQRGERMLKETGKDLRVVQLLALAWLMEEGVSGLESGFRLAAALLERYGAELHPRPDEDDPSDVSAREMVVSEMINGEPFVRALRECVLLEAAGVGRFSGRDVEVMDTRLEDDRAGGARSVPEITAIAQAAGGSSEAGNTALRVAAEGVCACADAVTDVVRRFDAGSLHGDRVPRLLTRMTQLLQAALQGESAEATAATAEQGGTPGAIVTQAGGNGAAMGQLRTRDDARRLILQISKFLEQTEPSHPAPFFLRRAERLLGAKDFFAIVRDMAPESIAELERITGHHDNGDASSA